MGGKYEDLKKTITINIVDFNLFDFSRFHSTFHFYEDHEEHFMLTDVMSVHFIEYPKFFAAKKDLNDPLHRWLLFLEEKLPDDQLKELVQMDPVIKKTEVRLEWLSSDPETLRLYEAREHSRIEYNSNIAYAEERGEAKGKAKGKAEVALNMLRSGIDLAQIAQFTGLSVEEIERIQKANGNK